jgi:hypothetical protein
MKAHEATPAATPSTAKAASTIGLLRVKPAGSAASGTKKAGLSPKT